MTNEKPLEGRTLFILDEPYVSGFALDTLSKLQVPVLKTALISKIQPRALNLVDKIDAGAKIYSNSENAIDRVLESAPGSKTATFVRLCKDKGEFRKRLQGIYPSFYFRTITPGEFDTARDLPAKFVIKPTVGFLSMGVHKIESPGDWEKAKASIRTEINDFSSNFPQSVLSGTEFIVEELIEGDEFAIDVYFDGAHEPVILNIFKHPFAGKDDVSDRLYLTSREIIKENIGVFTSALERIARAFGFENFPAHIEVIKDKSGNIIPVEINPMRFAGWCTTDLAYFAYGINVYDHFHNGKRPDWDAILEECGAQIYYFALAETPPDIDKTAIAFDHESFRRCFSRILDYRIIDHTTKPLFAIIFGVAASQDEIDAILKLKTKDFVLCGR